MIETMPKLFLIPNAINEGGFDVPDQTARAIAGVRLFFVEEPKSARRLLKAIHKDFPLHDCRLLDLNEHTKSEQFKEYMVLAKKEDSGIISESGCPCVADPGSGLVLLAHKNNIGVVPLAGPSSIVLALMASGLNGQNFAFNGYLPKNPKERAAKIKALGQRACKEGQTQIIMETPYRNQNVFDDLLKNLDQKIFLCVACDMMGNEPFIRTKSIAEWQESNSILPKKPALFIINKG